MAEDSITLPLVKLAVPKPKRWDLVALAVLAASLGAALVNLRLAFATGPGEAIGGSATTGFALGQLALCCLGLLVLGKTAKEGTLWGNLLAVGAMFAGMSGLLLAAALWSAA